MQYELRIEDVSPIRRRLHFTVNQDHVKSELDRAFRDLKDRVKLPGFRPGHVPRHLLEARFGKQIKSEVGGRLIESSYQEAARELEVAGQPAVEDSGDVSIGETFSFVIGVDVRPEITVTGYSGVEVPYVVSAVEDAQVDEAVQARVAGQTRITEVSEKRPVELGDLVVTQLALNKDGETVVDEPGTMIHTMAERYYPGVEALVLGMKQDDEKTAEVTIGAEAVEESLRGQVFDATIKIIAIHAQVTPDLTDDLAKELGYEGGAAGMRAAIRMQLDENAEEAARNQARVDLLQALVDLNDFEVPAGMVEEQLQALIEELKIRRAYGGADPRSIRFTDAEITDLRNRATFAAKASCILASVAKAESIEVNDADLEDKVREIAEMRGQAIEAIRGYLEREGAWPVLRTRISEEKTLEWLIERADLKPMAAAAPAEKPAKKAPAKAAKKAPAKAAAPEWNKKMKKDELLVVAEQMGLDANAKMKKDDIIALIEGAS